MTVFEALRADHDVQRGLVASLVDTSGDSASRRRLFDKLKAELTAHAAAEERHFYVPLMQDDLTIEKARHSIAEHHELDELVEELESTDMGSAGWLATARKSNITCSTISRRRNARCSSWLARHWIQRRKRNLPPHTSKKWLHRKRMRPE